MRTLVWAEALLRVGRRSSLMVSLGPLSLTVNFKLPVVFPSLLMWILRSRGHAPRFCLHFLGISLTVPRYCLVLSASLGWARLS